MSASIPRFSNGKPWAAPNPLIHFYYWRISGVPVSSTKHVEGTGNSGGWAFGAWRREAQASRFDADRCFRKHARPPAGLTRTGCRVEFLGHLVRPMQSRTADAGFGRARLQEPWRDIRRGIAG